MHLIRLAAKARVQPPLYSRIRLAHIGLGGKAGREPTANRARQPRIGRRAGYDLLYYELRKFHWSNSI